MIFTSATDVALTLLASALTGVFTGWVLRRMLGQPFGWPRCVAVGVIAGFAIVPLTTRIGIEAGVFGEDWRILVPGTVLLTFLAVVAAWFLVACATVLIVLELFVPTKPWIGFTGQLRRLRMALRRMRRTAQIIAVLSSTGLRRSLRRGEGPDSTRFAESLVEALNRSGVTFVKLGQFLATQPDVVPPETARALSSLQADAARVPFTEVRRIVEAELGSPVEDLFRQLDETPLAAASIGQVHRGVLTDGTVVAVKIQRPGIAAQVRADADILLRLTSAAEHRYAWARDMSLRSLTTGLVRALFEELDFRTEARNMALVKAASDESGVHVPAVYDQLSGARVLTMELLEGVPLSSKGDVERRLALVPASDRTALATDLVRAVFHGVLTVGVFHADLHPGNVMLLRDGRLGLLDFGSVGVLDDESRRVLGTLLYAVLHDDTVTAADAVVLGFDAPPDLDVRALRRDLGRELTILTRMHTFDMQQMSRLFDVLRTNRVEIPGHVAAALRTLASVRSAVQRLDPDADVLGLAAAQMDGIAATMREARATAPRLAGTAAIASTVGRRLPERIDRITGDLVAGRLSVRTRAFASLDDRDWVRGTVDAALSVLLACAAFGGGVVLLTSDGGLALTPSLTISTLLGWFVCFLGAVLALRVLARIFTQRVTRSRGVPWAAGH